MRISTGAALGVLMLSATAVLAAPAASSPKAAPEPCTTHPKKGTKHADLAALAKVTKDDAQKTALESLGNGSDMTVGESELEVEHGCLIWSFDIRVKGKKGVEEVHVDAGDGKVLAHVHESAKREAAERASDKPKAAAPTKKN